MSDTPKKDLNFILAQCALSHEELATIISNHGGRNPDTPILLTVKCGNAECGIVFFTMPAGLKAGTKLCPTCTDEYNRQRKKTRITEVRELKKQKLIEEYGTHLPKEITEIKSKRGEM